MKELENLWKEIDLCEECRSFGNELQHILGGGEENNPSIMFVFINPTHRNISSHPDYSGPRFPFIGTNEIWNIFVKSNILSEEVIQKTKNNWNKDSIEFLLNSLKNRKIYLTNVVKCTKSNAENPTSNIIKKKLPFLFKEIDMVNPKLIVTLGQIPFKTLTDKNIKLSDYHKKQIESKKLILYDSKEINGKVYKVFPCYFPVGRGNRKEAIELLSILNKVIK
jgi:uracil-DNA glycosylase family 4